MAHHDSTAARSAQSNGQRHGKKDRSIPKRKRRDINEVERKWQQLPGSDQLRIAGDSAYHDNSLLTYATCPR